VAGKVIVAFSFGKPSTTKGNKLTAIWAERNADYHQSPLVIDRSVPVETSNFKGELFYVGSEAQKHKSTLSLAEEFVELAIQKEWSPGIVVGHPDYIDRVVDNINELFRRRKYQGYAYKTTVLGHDKAKTWYDRNSIQWWTRYRPVFLIYEWIWRTMPFEWYERFASTD
jgi:hypothetical protein